MTKLTRRTNRNYTIGINPAAIYDKHSSTYLTNPQRQPANTNNNEQDKGLSSQEHQRRNYKQQSSLRLQHRRQTPSRTLPRVTSQVVAGLSRTQEPTSQVVEPLPLFIEFSEAEPKPPKELHQSTTGNKEHGDDNDINNNNENDDNDNNDDDNDDNNNDKVMMTMMTIIMIMMVIRVESRLI
ncbi:hypothetical protein Glove_186g85 [Diversispora epigaea]|uniref:Uncharacterized protein n=1 Tax=Diversispora epigaea TaxID=1348612 RepID=A0A397IPX6_9GLOM|nr:hypothetical protein Glove_186g85 [Diversispora epigaea]